MLNKPRSDKARREPTLESLAETEKESVRNVRNKQTHPSSAPTTEEGRAKAPSPAVNVKSMISHRLDGNTSIKALDTVIARSQKQSYGTK